VVHPFGVASTAGKLRLICDAKCLNIFLELFPFRYEKLRDVLAYTQAGFFMVTWDLKAGYYHLPIHPAFRKFFGFKVGNRYGVYNAICFGLSEACFAFTKVMQEPLIELRARRIPVSGYIDDGHSAARTYGRTLRQAYFIIRLLAALGVFFGLPKCHFQPSQEQAWLGFLLNTLTQTFTVAPSKLEKVKAVLESAIQQPTTSARNLAALAGKLVALSPAVLPALLFSRKIFQAMSGKEDWDFVFPNPQAVKTEAQMWKDNLDSWNGRRWWPRPCKLRLQIDASAVGYGGFIEAENLARVKVAGTFNQAEASESSAARETIGYVRAIQTACEQFPSHLHQASVLLLGDSQAALAAFRKFASSNAFIHDSLTTLFHLCARHKFDVIPRWIPRENLAEADELSRRPDASDWGCTTELVTIIASKFGVNIDLDMFASDNTHVTTKFVSPFYTPGCTAVHALAFKWRQLLSQPDATVWVFPPTKLLSHAISIIEAERINAILIVPTRTATNEWSQITNLPGQLSQPFHLPKRAELCKPSLRVPPESINPIVMGLTAFHIYWPSGEIVFYRCNLSETSSTYP
jgi:hypothetical protein